MGYPLASFARASRFVRMDPAPGRLRAEWLRGYRRFQAAGEPASAPFWRAGAAAYRRVPEKAPVFSLENVLDFLERREHPEHL